MLRLTFVVIAVYGMCCAMALAQTAPPAPTAQGGSYTRQRPAAPSPVAQQGDTPGPAVAAPAFPARHSNSLLRAASANPTDPTAPPDIKSISMFAVPAPEPKTIKKHDLVTIIIREESEVSAAGTTDLKRQSDLEAKVDEFMRINLKNFALQPAIGATPPGIKVSGTRNFKGEATVDRTDSVITRVTAEVLDVKPNGTLVLHARKKIKTDEEEQTLIAAGICRVEDITPDNTVLSTQLFDLEFSKTNKGQVRNTTKTGALHKLLDFINPF
jgi:flagellar L-ring protein precursor FlgH